MKNKSLFYLYEPLLLYSILFLPGISFTSAGASGAGGHISDFFTSLNTLLFYSAFSISQIIFILYFFQLKKTDKDLCGIKMIRKTDILYGIFYFFILGALSASVTALLVYSGIITESFQVKINMRYLPYAAAISIITGYREELFFRSYLLTALTERGGSGEKASFDGKRTMISAAVVSSLLFSLSHLYQGPGGGISAFCSSMVLAWIFYRHKNIHIIAAAHAIYNFTAIAVSSF